MSEKSALYLTIARRCAAQGETGRAIVTVVNALRNNPQYLETQPEAVDFLAEILIPGFEEEIHKLQTRYPSFGYRFYDALAAHGKREFASELEQSFNAYCVERMKTVQCRDDMAFTNRTVQNYMHSGDVASIPMESYRQTAAESGFFRAAPRDPWRQQTRSQDSVMVPAVSQAVSPTMQVQLPKDVWIPSIQQNISSNGQMGYEKHEFASRNIDSCSSDGMRRFDRIRTQHVTRVNAEDYADSAADRVILDFDNRIKETPKAAMFAASRTKFKSFAEDLADWREASKTEQKRQILAPVQNPMEVVAETTHALSETPSVEPYALRHPIRFSLAPQHIVTCVFVCLLAILGWVTWHTIEPKLERNAIEGVSDSYLAAADSGIQNPVESVRDDSAVRRFVGDAWMDAYRQFLNTWQNIYYDDDNTPFIDPDDEILQGEYSSVHAAYIMQEISRGHLERARRHFESVPARVWREHPYFKTWSEAQISVAQREYRSGAIQYEKLLRTPLAPFALVQLGLLSLEDSQAKADIQQRFSQAILQSDSVPNMARCAHDVMTRRQSLAPTPRENARLKSPYAEYCAIGRIFSSIDRSERIDRNDLEVLERSPALSHGEAFRLEAIIEAELYEQHPEAAVAFYRTLDLPEGHPLRAKLLNGILSRSLYFGNWGSLHALNSEIPEDIGVLAAARLIDGARESGSLKADYRRAESLVKFQTAKAPAAVDSLMDEAYVEAIDGNTARALSVTRSILSSHPDYVEPLILQAMILSRTGYAKEAASILEHGMMTGAGAAPLIVLSNLYRARANLKLNRSSFILPFLSFEDNVLESARCEIFWRQNDSRAAGCLDALNARSGHQARAAWFMNHVDRSGRPMGSSAEWAKVSAGAMSIPGFYLAYGRKLLAEGEFQGATRAYTKAILSDFSTLNREVIDEFARIYSSRQRRYEGTKKFEEIIAIAEKDNRYADMLGPLHIAAAYLYQPENAHSTARQHLGRALDLMGDQPEILRGLVQYYEAKERPEQARTWRIRLQKAIAE